MSIEEVLANDDTRNFLKKTIKQCNNDEDYYENVLSHTVIPHKFIYDNLEIFNLPFLVKHGKLQNETVTFLFEDDDIDVKTLLHYQQLPEDTLIKYIDKLDDEDMWCFIQEYQAIPCKIMEKYKDKLDWKLVSESQFFDIRFMYENVNNIQWSSLPFNPRMKHFINEGVITLFQHTNIWDSIGYCDAISIDTMFKYQEHFTKESWNSILDYREEELSEEQLELVKSKINIEKLN